MLEVLEWHEQRVQQEHDVVVTGGVAMSEGVAAAQAWEPAGTEVGDAVATVVKAHVPLQHAGGQLWLPVLAAMAVGSRVAASGLQGDQPLGRIRSPG